MKTTQCTARRNILYIHTHTTPTHTTRTSHAHHTHTTPTYTAQMTLTAVFKQGAILKKLIDAIRELVVDINIEYCEDGLALQAMDSSHVALCTIILNAAGFQTFTCDQPGMLGLNTQSLAKLLKCATNDDIITLKTTAQNQDVLGLVFEGQKQEFNKITEFDLKLLVIDEEQLEVPETEYDYTIQMPSAEFLRIIKNLSDLGDSCTISLKNGTVQFASSGDIADGTITLEQTNTNNGAEHSDETAVVIAKRDGGGDDLKLNFSLRYLLIFAKASAMCPTVHISVLSNVPIMIQYNIGAEPDYNHGNIRFYLAPKIDDA